MFDIRQSQVALVEAIAKLDPSSLGNYATVDDLENNAGYIETLLKAVAEHIEEVMADASSSQSFAQIDEEDARAIKDLGQDLAAQLNNAAWKMDAERAA